MLYLNPRNKSNNAIDRNTWSDYNGKYTGTLTDAHYGNYDGWLLNNNGVSYLKLASGAKFNIPSFRPFKYDPTKKTQVDQKMGYGMTIEFDFEIKGVLDYDTELVKCISYTTDRTKIAVGFAISGNSIKFYDSNSGADNKSLISLNLIENKRTKVSFVIEPNTGTVEYPMIYAYLNGILSAAVMYKGSFVETQDYPALLTLDSSAAQIDIYSIRFYSTALSNRTILNNYTASLDTITERQNLFDSNNVYDSSDNISYSLVSAEDYDLQIPYMLLTGGY
jgi:hypothetical protein